MTTSTAGGRCLPDGVNGSTWPRPAVTPRAHPPYAPYPPGCNHAVNHPRSRHNSEGRAACVCCAMVNQEHRVHDLQGVWVWGREGEGLPAPIIHRGVQRGTPAAASHAATFT